MNDAESERSIDCEMRYPKSVRNVDSVGILESQRHVTVCTYVATFGRFGSTRLMRSYVAATGHGKLRPNDPLASPAVHWDYHNRPRWDGSCHDHKFTTQLQRQSALKSCFHELSARMHTVHTYNIAYCNFVSFTYIRTYCQCGFLLQMRLPTTVRTSGILPRQQ